MKDTSDTTTPDRLGDIVSQAMADARANRDAILAEKQAAEARRLERARMLEDLIRGPIEAVLKRTVGSLTSIGLTADLGNGKTPSGHLRRSLLIEDRRRHMHSLVFESQSSYASPVLQWYTSITREPATIGVLTESGVAAIVEQFVRDAILHGDFDRR